MAPEVINGKPYDFACDIYAFGVGAHALPHMIRWFERPATPSCRCAVANEMANRRPPWSDLPEPPGRTADARAYTIMRTVASGVGRPALPNRPIKPEFLRLVERCWAQEPGRRPSFGEVWRELGQLGDEYELRIPSKEL
eukprot:SAG11_NODE_3067_length_2715_cov_1.530581_4_plen_139_part_00